jgi:hypothetical protein
VTRPVSEVEREDSPAMAVDDSLLLSSSSSKAMGLLIELGGKSQNSKVSIGSRQ